MWGVLPGFSWVDESDLTLLTQRPVFPHPPKNPACSPMTSKQRSFL